jgi:hypothetical protein
MKNYKFTILIEKNLGKEEILNNTFIGVQQLEICL